MDASTPTDDLLTFTQLTRRLRRYGITRAWLEAEVQAGRIPCLKTGRRRLFNFEAVKGELLRRAAEGGDHDQA